MKKIILILLLVTPFFITGCYNAISKDEAKEKLQDLFQIPISDKIEISDYENSYSTTSDYTESFIVNFSKEEFMEIFDKLKPVKANNNNNLAINSDIYGYSVEKGNEHISAIFDPKRYTIKYTYRYE